MRLDPLPCSSTSLCPWICPCWIHSSCCWGPPEQPQGRNLDLSSPGSAWNVLQRSLPAHCHTRQRRRSQTPGHSLESLRTPRSSKHHNQATSGRSPPRSMSPHSWCCSPMIPPQARVSKQRIRPGTWRGPCGSSENLQASCPARSRNSWSSGHCQGPASHDPQSSAPSSVFPETVQIASGKTMPSPSLEGPPCGWSVVSVLHGWTPGCNPVKSVQLGGSGIWKTSQNPQAAQSMGQTETLCPVFQTPFCIHHWLIVLHPSLPPSPMTVRSSESPNWKWSPSHVLPSPSSACRSHIVFGILGSSWRHCRRQEHGNLPWWCWLLSEPSQLKPQLPWAQRRGRCQHVGRLRYQLQGWCKTFRPRLPKSLVSAANVFTGWRSHRFIWAHPLQVVWYDCTCMLIPWWLTCFWQKLHTANNG